MHNSTDWLHTKCLFRFVCFVHVSDMRIDRSHVLNTYIILQCCIEIGCLSSHETSYTYLPGTF